MGKRIGERPLTPAERQRRRRKRLRAEGKLPVPSLRMHVLAMRGDIDKLRLAIEKLTNTLDAQLGRRL
jgi:hypothetical protein